MAKGNGVNYYIIPENFIEGGRILNGMFKTRNFIEACILTFLVGIIFWNIQYPSTTIKLSVVTIFVAPIFLISVAGINDGSILQFITKYFKYRKKRRVMLYNGQTRSRLVRPVEVMLAQELTKDKLVDTIENWKENKRKQNTQTMLVQGKDFEFIDDEAEHTSFVATENKILGKNEPQKADDKPKKRKNKKNVKLLSEKTSSKPIHDVEKESKSEEDDVIYIDNSEDSENTLIDTVTIDENDITLID